MKEGRRKCNLYVNKKNLSIRMLPILLFITFHITQIIAQNTTSADSVTSVPATAGANPKIFGGKITNNGYGGSVLRQVVTISNAGS